MARSLTLADFVFEVLALKFVPLQSRSRAMPKYLEPNEIVEAIENAFSPLECRVELFDHRNRSGFTVFDTDGTLILPLSSWLARLVRKPDSLRTRINVLRKRVEAEGYTLDPWTFPA